MRTAAIALTTALFAAVTDAVPATVNQSSALAPETQGGCNATVTSTVYPTATVNATPTPTTAFDLSEDSVAVRARTNVLI